MKKLLIFLFGYFLFLNLCFADFNLTINDNYIYFNNNSKIEKNQSYLIWFDLDKNKFLSFTNKNKWLAGIYPFSNIKITIPPFKGKIASIPEKCPEGDRCFVGIAFLYDNNTYDLAIFPLSVEASYERLPGQIFFGYSETSKEFLPLSTKKEVINQEVEKPDIYKFDDKSKLLLFANKEAGLFEIVNLSNPAKPEIIAKTNIQGSPKEIYKLFDNYYIIISKNNNFTNIFSFIYDNSKGLSLIDNKTFEGSFLESRRKQNVIFIVTRLNSKTINVYAININENGKIILNETESFENSLKFVSIFSNFLILNFNNFYSNNELLRIISIGNLSNPLGEEFKIEVNGYIPSDRHIYVKDNYLMFVTSPQWKDFKNGNNFYVYKIENSSVKLVANIDKIAPGEQLYATEFTDNKAYLVTYKRKDPLWVIDISNPEQPSIIGELIVPGWSEKLFFNNDRLFSVGYYNNLVSVGLFDVSNPEKPELLSRLTPLEGETKYSYSEAISDERALYLDWKNSVASLPIETWLNKSRHFVQAIGIENDSLIDLGINSLPFKAKRTIWIDKNHVIAISFRELIVFKNENGKLTEISRIPLTLSADIIGLYENNIVGISAYENVYRMHFFDKELNLEKEIPIENSYSGDAVFNKKNSKILFYNLNPLQFLLYSNDNFIDITIEEFEKKLIKYNRLSPYLSDDKIVLPLFFSNVKYPLFKREASFYAVQFFKLPDFEASEVFTIPGQPAGLDIDGNLITFEHENKNNYLRINLLSISDLGTKLLDTKVLDECKYFSSQVFVGKRKIFIKCGDNNYYYILKAKKKSEPENENYNNKIYVLNIKNNKFLLEKSFTLNEVGKIVAINEDANLILTTPEMYKYTLPIWYNPECKVYNISGESPNLIKTIKDENCYFSKRVILLKDKVIIGEQERGIKRIDLK